MERSLSMDTVILKLSRRIDVISWVRLLSFASFMPWCP